MWYSESMRRKIKIVNCILTCGLGALLCISQVQDPLTAEATTASEIQGQINQNTNTLNQINSQIVALETEQELLQEQMDDLNAEIVNTMTSIGVKEDEIAAKKNEITDKENQITEKGNQIVRKQGEIDETQREYEAAVEREEAQREGMMICARLIYERGDDTYLDALLSGKGFSDILNQMDRVERVYEYENSMLLEYIEVKNQVHDLWERLEEEKAGLEADKQQLEADKQVLENDRQQLEADQAELRNQKANLDSMMAKKKQESANFEAEIAKARQAAAAAKKQIQQDQQRLKQLQAQNNSSSGGGGGGGTRPSYNETNYSATINNASGSDLGKSVANYACQFIGNPYVSGGTSLTNGADCSGFTYRVYSEFGYSLPRTSYQQRSAGTGVDFSNAQPGDILCYEGHVAIYIGDGLIVHASNSNPYPSGGIKISQAQYRPIVAVRRIVN